MQLLEGERRSIPALEGVIIRDKRHVNIYPEICYVSSAGANTNWAMRSIALNDYEVPFEEIKNAETQTPAIKIASALFDITFQPER